MDIRTLFDKAYKVLRGEQNKPEFAREFFCQICDEQGDAIIRKYSESAIKKFYNGDNFHKLASKINTHLDFAKFKSYIDNQDGYLLEQLVDSFEADISGITMDNIAWYLSTELMNIISEAAKGTSNESIDDDNENIEVDEYIYTGPLILEPNMPLNELSSTIIEKGRKVIQSMGLSVKDDNDISCFSKYIRKAYEYYSEVRIFLNLEQPQKFYDYYVCNDISQRYYFKKAGTDGDARIIRNATVEKLSTVSKFIVLSGIGGIGKSMMLRHLFLNSLDTYEESGKLPILVSLRNYHKESSSLIDLITKAIADFDSDIKVDNILEMLNDGSCILLFDAIDEIASSQKAPFVESMEAFTKQYSDNVFIMSSRPTDNLTSFNRFTICDVEPLELEQALELIDRIKIWNEDAKSLFRKKLKTELYYTHTEFAENPLLLTIMLMTYSEYGEIPARIHKFYEKAYLTMSRTHDFTKSSYVRPLATNLSPEDYKEYFARFCANTYNDEKIDFTEAEFSKYMKDIIQKIDPKLEATPRDFLTDACENVCLMYKNGDRYYFIHRSFQEYFTAYYFSNLLDDMLTSSLIFWKKNLQSQSEDQTFEMLYDMIPNKVEICIFLPYLKEIVGNIPNEDEDYLLFANIEYPTFFGFTDLNDFDDNGPFFKMYEFITEINKLSHHRELAEYKWPIEFADKYYFASYIEDEDTKSRFATLKNPIKHVRTVNREHYHDDDLGTEMMFSIQDIIDNPDEHEKLKAIILKEDFPLKKEYRDVVKYIKMLENRKEKAKEEYSWL